MLCWRSGYLSDRRIGTRKLRFLSAYCQRDTVVRIVDLGCLAVNVSFIYWLCSLSSFFFYESFYSFMAALGFSLLHGLFSSCGEWGYSLVCCTDLLQ